MKDVGGLHAAIPKAPYLSLFSRANSFTRKMLDEELYEKRMRALDGRVVGVGDAKEGKKTVVKILLFEEVKDRILMEIYSKAQKIGKFITGEEIKI